MQERRFSAYCYTGSYETALLWFTPVTVLNYKGNVCVGAGKSRGSEQEKTEKM